MEIVEKIVKQKYAPNNPNVIWLDASDANKPILKTFFNGTWRPLTSAGADDVVKYTEQDLTLEEQQQARSNIGAASLEDNEIFWATYGTTTAAEIDAAVAAGKVVAVKVAYSSGSNEHIHYLSQTLNSTRYEFFALDTIEGNYLYVVKCNKSNSAWNQGRVALQGTGELIDTLAHLIDNRTSTTKYPSAKATYDLVHPAVQSTQPQDGFAPNVEYNLGTLSGSVTFALATPVDVAISNHYYWTFDTSSTAPTITWPSGITWYGGSAPTINASKHYEISVLNNIGVAMEV